MKTRGSVTATDGTCSANRSYLTRRLIQAGVPIVQANMGHMNNWDTHIDNCNAAQDPALAASGSGGLGIPRRPGSARSIRGDPGRDGRRVRPHAQDRPEQRQRSQSAHGRDHWAGVFSALFAGGGVRGGQMIGRSDKIGAYPATRGYYPSDLGATIYRALGVDPASRGPRPARPAHAAQPGRAHCRSVRRVDCLTRRTPCRLRLTDSVNEIFPAAV